MIKFNKIDFRDIDSKPVIKIFFMNLSSDLNVPKKQHKNFYHFQPDNYYIFILILNLNIFNKSLNHSKKMSLYQCLFKVSRSIITLMAVTILLNSCSEGNLLKPGKRAPEGILLEKQGSATRLVVDDTPLLMLGGELHNSSMGGIEYMRPIWKRMAEANLNTVIATASWELVEPEEGKFDFALVDSMILGAREQGLKLVVIWFGSWKNSASTYAPSWVKLDQKRFPLAKDEKGNTLNILSTFSDEALKADAKAFAALMKHIRKADSKFHTVVMMQIENEIGTLRTKRDYSEAANLAFNGPVPSELIDYLIKNKSTIHPGVLRAWVENGSHTAGTWEQVFGKGAPVDDWKGLSYLTEELFMAWNYAKYVERVAEAGKAEYNIPMYVNAWLKQPRGPAPGDYPSGGPTPQVIDIWRAAAPSVDFIAPDIYIVNEFRYICDQYTLSGNPLFIPETTGDAASAARAFYAFGRYSAICYSPFGIDGGDSGANVSDLSDIKDSYATLNRMIPLIAKYQGTENMTGLLVSDQERNDTVVIGGYKLAGSLGRRFLFPGAGNQENSAREIPRVGGALIISTGPGEYIIAGRNMNLNFLNADSTSNQKVSFLSLEDGTINGNQWISGRRLNGDEFRVSFPLDKSKIYKLSLYKY